MKKLQIKVSFQYIYIYIYITKSFPRKKSIIHKHFNLLPIIIILINELTTVNLISNKFRIFLPICQFLLIIFFSKSSLKNKLQLTNQIGYK
jgi:hypothetical protein